MAEYAYNPAQSVNAGAPVILNTVIPCNKGFVYHREQSGILVLRGKVCGNNCFARYQVTFNGNIALPDGGSAAITALRAIRSHLTATSPFPTAAQLERLCLSQ